jgi:hypothetical protein
MVERGNLSVLTTIAIILIQMASDVSQTSILESQIVGHPGMS